MRAEICAFLGDATGVWQALSDADAAQSFAVAELERCPLFAPFRSDPLYTLAHARVEARAAQVREPLRSAQ